MDGLLVYHVLPTLGWIELKSDPLNPMDACWLPPDPARPVARARTLHAESPRSAHLGNREWTGGSSQQQTGRNVKFTIQLVHSISIQLINLHQNHQKNERWKKKRKLFGTPPMVLYKRRSIRRGLRPELRLCSRTNAVSSSADGPVGGSLRFYRWSHGEAAAMAGKSMEIIELPSGNLT
jgi:hypothetical protein